jgi:hypothetical protein
MGLHAHRPMDCNPFLQFALNGWRPSIPHIRYPVTFGHYREGDNWGLFLAPTDLACVRDALKLASTDSALVMEGAQVLDEAFLEAPHAPRLIPWHEIATLSGDVDLVHIPQDAHDAATQVDLVTPVLAAPGRAVPTDIGSRVAIGLNDGCHVAVISPDLPLIQGCLERFIQDYIVSVLRRDTDLPELSPRLVHDLLAPMPAGAWCELMLHVHKRYWTLDLQRQGGEATPTRWVSEGEGGRWRDGWSW